MDTKHCNKCNLTRYKTEFAADKRNKDGLQGICEICRKAAKHAKRAKKIAEGSPISVSHKTCNRCLQNKTANEFYRDSGIADGLNTICKTCRNISVSSWRDANREAYNKSMRDFRANEREWAKNTDLMRTYGITLEDYNKMAQEQEFVCKICKKPANGIRPLAVAHDHKTGKIRGLLCYNCNRVLSLLDNTELYDQAKKYLKS